MGPKNHKKTSLSSHITQCLKLEFSLNHHPENIYPLALAKHEYYLLINLRSKLASSLYVSIKGSCVMSSMLYEIKVFSFQLFANILYLLS